MDPYVAVKEKLKELDISFELVEHEPVLTTEQADSFIKGIDEIQPILVCTIPKELLA